MVSFKIKQGKERASLPREIKLCDTLSLAKLAICWIVAKPASDWCQLQNTTTTTSTLYINIYIYI
ncbi:Uncharacterized protein TCM_020715 [Theobroma cacao]|uniref:Uncharacterized protein n=1 Tax=Theobroma cacao TaxID=3641 RepID=A0A061ELB0_THECC|nr:Uncharacterized protein TCM_020715 [Theobroma cacao]